MKINQKDKKIDDICVNYDCNSFDPIYKLNCCNRVTRPPDCNAFKKKNKENEREKKKIRDMVNFIIKAYRNKPEPETVDRLVNHYFNLKIRIRKDGLSDERY